MADDVLFCAPCVHFTGSACRIDKVAPGEDITTVSACNFREKKLTATTPTTSTAAMAKAAGDFVRPDQMVGKDGVKAAKTASDAPTATTKASGDAPAQKDDNA